MDTASIAGAPTGHRIVDAARWTEERVQLLAREKALTRLHDEVAAARRALPWRRIDKDYVFDTAQGRRTLAGLFGERSQLIVQHFMFGPGWEQGCPSCSFMADHVDGMTIHLAHRDIAFVAVSRAPLPDLLRFRERRFRLHHSFVRRGWWRRCRLKTESPAGAERQLHVRRARVETATTAPAATPARLRNLIGNLRRRAGQ